MEEQGIELTEDIKVQLYERRDELVKTIEAFASLEKSKEWETIKTLVFDKSMMAIERQILNESLSPEINTSKIYKLQGELKWARHYHDVGRFIGNLKKELEGINKKIK